VEAVPSEVHPIGTAPKAVNLPKKSTKTEVPLAERSALLGATGEVSFLSPRVRAKVAEAGLKSSDLTAIVGTGIGGRITAEDIDKYLATGEPMSPVRQAVANAMSRSWSRPLATVARPAGMDPLLAHRRTVEGRPSATIYALRALALALAQGTPLSARMFGNRLIRAQSIDLAVAVEIDGGVLTPVVRGVDQIPLDQLTTTVEQVIDKARQGRVADSGDAVATVSNYGTFGLTWATPIPLSGQPMILGIGAVQNVPEWNPATQSWGRARAAELTLTFDHRVADGGAAGRLLGLVVDLLEKPEKMA
jgi:pyruvate/2-oxoglutarate dehydrogenase complex dihydrolipoamide acyltransferase (E2) component